MSNWNDHRLECALDEDARRRPLAIVTSDELSARINRLRAELGLGFVDMAHALGVNVRDYMRLANGEAFCDWDDAERRLREYAARSRP